MTLFKNTKLIFMAVVLIFIFNQYDYAYSKPKKEKQAPAAVQTAGESMTGSIEWNVVMHDDNNNDKLSKQFRTWWYVRLDGVIKGNESVIHIQGDGFKGGVIVVPVYSYDNEIWHRFNPKDITSDEITDGLYNYTIRKKFNVSGKVWIARYYPYQYSRLENLLKKYKKDKFAKIEKIGASAQGRAIKMISITDPSFPDKNKRRVWIHSRTHPSETGSSFIIEGLIDYLLSESTKCSGIAALDKIIYNIVPMVNVDGVVLGNARVSPGTSYDLERMWIRDKKTQYELRETCPPEVKAMHKAIKRLNKKGPAFFAALNIHSKNAAPLWRSFIYTNFYSNFDKKNKVYGEQGDSLFVKQLMFAKLMTDAMCKDSFYVRPSFESNAPISKKTFPEAWWWINYKDKVMAATLETTSGSDGCYEELITYKDHFHMGRTIAEAMKMLSKYYVEQEWFRYENPPGEMKDLLPYYRYGKKNSKTSDTKKKRKKSEKK
ncbi:MAG: M14 family zinc carboxypeptidase [Candidatus Kapabacteria bacterium]|nr:M14 family zinc carboxypeptidase [Candidatus Kapabacteria bacterium]